MKLSPVQKRVLLEILQQETTPLHYRCITNYAPAKKLVELGLAFFADSSFGNAELILTDAGRQLANILK